MKRAAVFGLLLSIGASWSAMAGDAISFAGKSGVMVVGSPSGDGTDASARLIAAYLGKQLPGEPAIIVQNLPGAQGTTAANYFVQQVAADGLTLLMAGVPAADPLYYRRPQAHFDPTKFNVVGGISRGGTALIINKEAEKRLTDKTAAPVIMGSLGGVPRAGMQVAAWGQQFLNWNVKWVVGYPGTAELLTALARGEIDMTSTAVPSQVQQLVGSGKFKIISQSGSLQGNHFIPQPTFLDAPIFADLIQAKLKDPLVTKSFTYWSAINSVDQWLALPPNTPEAIVGVYRAAYAKMIEDRDFLDHARKLGDLNFRSHEDVEYLLDTLAGTPPEALTYVSTMLRNQGLQVE